MLGVASSSLGPFSVMMCRTCIEHRAEPTFAFDYIVEEIGANVNDYVFLLTTFVDGRYVSCREYATSKGIQFVIPETLLFEPCGPMVRYRENTLFIEDLNPQVNLNWRMTTKELLIFGLRCVRRAIQVELKTFWNDLKKELETLS